MRVLVHFIHAILLSGFLPNVAFGFAPALYASSGRSTFKLWTATGESETGTLTLFERIGGEAALTAAVDEFYNRLVVDEKLMKYFEGADVDALRGHQYKFMKIAFTEIPKDLNIVEYLTSGHSRLWEMGLDETDFDAVAGHLVGTLESLEVPQELIDEVVGVVGPLRAIFEKKAES